MKKQFIRHSFSLTPKVNNLLLGIQEKTEMSYNAIIRQALEKLAKEKGIKDED